MKLQTKDCLGEACVQCRPSGRHDCRWQLLWRTKGLAPSCAKPCAPGQHDRLGTKGLHDGCISLCTKVPQLQSHRHMHWWYGARSLVSAGPTCWGPSLASDGIAHARMCVFVRVCWARGYAATLVLHQAYKQPLCTVCSPCGDFLALQCTCKHCVRYLVRYSPHSGQVHSSPANLQPCAPHTGLPLQTPLNTSQRHDVQSSYTRHTHGQALAISAFTASHVSVPIHLVQPPALHLLSCKRSPTALSPSVAQPATPPCAACIHSTPHALKPARKGRSMRVPLLGPSSSAYQRPAAKSTRHSQCTMPAPHTTAVHLH